MKVEMHFGYSFDLIPENFQDKLVLFLFAKTAKEEQEGLEVGFYELNFSQGKTGGFVDPKNIHTTLFEGFLMGSVNIEDITHLTIYAIHS